MTTIDILLFDGFDELDGVGPFEAFANADLDVALVTLDGARPVTASHGLVVLATGGLRDADVVVVPGGGWNDRGATTGARTQERLGAIPDAIAAAHGRGATVAGVCTGGMLLAASGVLDGRPAVTHAGAMDELRALGFDVRPEARVVDTGGVLTCGGVTSGLDPALHLIERECGPDMAAAVAAEMEHERRGPVDSSSSKWKQTVRRDEIRRP